MGTIENSINKVNEAMKSIYGYDPEKAQNINIQFEEYNHENESPVVYREVDLSLYRNNIINEYNVSIDGLGKCGIYVYGNEGDNYPHLHIESKDKVIVNGRKKIFKGCVRLDCAEFFAHGNTKDTFKMLKGDASEDAAISFNKYMNSRDKETGKQMWEFFKDKWLEQHPYNSDEKLNKDIQNLSKMKYKDKPNYNNLV